MQICADLKRLYVQAARAEEGEVPRDTAAHQGHPLGWFPPGELEPNCGRTRQEVLLELEREEAILAAARADLAKILNLSGSDDEDGMVRQIAGTELAAYILREYHTCTFTTSPFNGYVYAMYKYSMHPYSIHDPCKHD